MLGTPAHDPDRGSGEGGGVSREYPYPPRMMTRGRAAHYCDLSEAGLERQIGDEIDSEPVDDYWPDDY